MVHIMQHCSFLFIDRIEIIPYHEYMLVFESRIFLLPNARAIIELGTKHTCKKPHLVHLSQAVV